MHELNICMFINADWADATIVFKLNFLDLM